MNPFDPNRRSFLLAAGALGMSHVLPQSAGPQGYVLGPNEGETVIHFRDHGKISIKVTPAKAKLPAVRRTTFGELEP